jgi:hypothetical protein
MDRVTGAPLTDRARVRLIKEISSTGRELTRSADLDPLLEQIGEARYVLLGEASHGTSEYYAFLYLDETQALHPLHVSPEESGKPPETYPSL